MTSIADITPQRVDPLTGKVTRKARVAVPKIASPPTRIRTSGATKRVVGGPEPRG